MTDTLAGQTVTPTDRGFVLTRLIAAPPEAVWRAWTEPDRMRWFFNPAQPTPPEPIEVDLRVGGAWRVMMDQGDERYWTGGVYRELVPYERIVFEWGATGGWPVLDPDTPDDRPVCELLLAPVGDGTQTEHVFTVTMPDGMTDERVAVWLSRPIKPGWADTIGRLVVEG
jgi:uncharacterized protein YndB with AHSA1/START domain